MGNSTSCLDKLRKVEPIEKNENLTPDSKDESEASVLNENRTCTDILFLALFIAFLIVLIGLLGFCMSKGDIDRIIYGYDNCGNICGKENVMDDKFRCKGANLTSQKYLYIEHSDHSDMSHETSSINRLCVSSCEEYDMKPLLNRCVSKTRSEYPKKFLSKSGIKNFFQEVSEDFHICWVEILCLFVMAFVLSFIIVFLLQYLVRILVWLVLIGVILASVIGTIWLWVKYDLVRRNTPEDSEVGIQRKNSWLAYSIIATIATICIVLVIFAMRKRVKLVIQLFKEAGKAIESIPLLLFEPFLTFLSIAVCVTLWIYFAMWIESSGDIEVKVANQSVQLAKDSTMRVARWYNLLALFWISQFIMGCQHCVIAGAVAAWFFTRDRDQLNCPILKSFQRLICYHLGTVACGSLIISLVQIIRVILKAVEYWLRDPQNKVLVFIATCCHCCLGCFEDILQYLTRNAYIETAIFGHPFFEAGRKAFNILSNNALRVFVINSVGDFVLFLGKAFVVLCTVLVGMEVIQQKPGIQHSWVVLILVGLFAYLVAHCFLTVYEMTIDTIFICFCEDCERNDGMSKPYYMSRGLMEFVQNSKKSIESNTFNAWSRNP